VAGHEVAGHEVAGTEVTITPGLAAVPGLSLEPDHFRQVLGHFCTGVTVITTVDADGPAGFTCQSFAAVSLDPPLVLFCPSRSSATWRRIERTRQFCANVLADGQRELARVFASSAAGKFDSAGWSPAPAGTPVLDGALAWVTATVQTVHEAGDHQVVIGRVTGLGVCRAGPALLFYRGRYALTADGADDGPPELVDTLLAWPRHADWI
jgi:3-hydroxy-9,10-secoandrosta-1,3,5(10)-triene-9,17-dione monooxygenase reductase component